MPTDGPLAGTPYFFLGRHPDREAELAAYICREHRRGRRLSAILDDKYVERCGCRGVLRAVLRRPDVIRALRRNIAADMRREQADLHAGRSGAASSHPRGSAEGADTRAGEEVRR